MYSKVANPKQDEDGRRILPEVLNGRRQLKGSDRDCTKHKSEELGENSSSELFKVSKT